MSDISSVFSNFSTFMAPNLHIFAKFLAIQVYWWVANDKILAILVRWWIADSPILAKHGIFIYLFISNIYTG